MKLSPRPRTLATLWSPPWTTTAAIACAVLGAMVARLIEHCCLADVPHVMDEIAYVLQTKTFALGRLSAPADVPRAAFNMWFVEDRWARFSIFPPGWPAVLALGMKVEATCWVNPLLHGATAFVLGAVVRRLAGDARAQVLATALYAFSPQALLLAASLMSHTLVAFCASIVLAACADCLFSTPRRWLIVAAGAALGLAATSRPLCACALLLASMVTIAHARVPLRVVAPAVVPMVAFMLALGVYNDVLTGGPMRFPQSVYFNEHLPPVNLAIFKYHPGCNDLGLGPSHGCEYSIRGGVHDLRNALSNSGDNLQAWLLLAGGGPLVFLAAGYALLDRAAGRRRLALLTPTVAVIVLYALYWYAGTCFGARFYHAGLPALILVAALGVWRLPARVPRVAFVGVWLALNAAIAWRAASELRDSYWGTDDRFEQVAKGWTKPPALVMVVFPKELLPMHPLRWTSPLIHGRAWLNSIRALAALGANSPLLDGRVVFAKFHPGLVDELRERFPHRSLWLYFDEIDRRRDRLVPYDAGLLPMDEPIEAPPDNFDGYKYDGEPRPLRR